MRANPSPHESVAVTEIAHRSTVCANPYRPVAVPQRFEAEGGVLWVRQPEFVIFVSQPLHLHREPRITRPERPSGLRGYSFFSCGKSRRRPAFASASASN